MLERRIDDRRRPRPTRSVDWIHTIHYIGRKLPDGYTWSGERLTKKQTTSSLVYLRPEIWKDVSQAAKKTKFDNARRLRLIHIIDPETMRTR